MRFDDGYAAWVWLTTPLPSLDGTTPLTLLAEGEVPARSRLRDPQARCAVLYAAGSVRCAFWENEHRLSIRNDVDLRR